MKTVKATLFQAVHVALHMDKELLHKYFQLMSRKIIFFYLCVCYEISTNDSFRLLYYYDNNTTIIMILVSMRTMKENKMNKLFFSTIIVFSNIISKGEGKINWNRAAISFIWYVMGMIHDGRKTLFRAVDGEDKNLICIQVLYLKTLVSKSSRKV